MSNPTRPVSSEQVRRFGLAICERLGVDPAIVGDLVQWEVNGDDELGKIQLSVYLPADEIIAMFNGAADVQ